jgi:hypothetical protein
MQNKNSSELIATLTSEIGVESAYYRKEKDRLYLSGIEIAMIVATGVFSSFFIGLFEGIKKGISKKAEKLGEDLIDSFVKQLQEIRKKTTTIESENTKDITKQIRSYQQDIDKIINNDIWQEALFDESQVLHGFQVEEVKAYLKEIGFPSDIVSDRAERLVLQIYIELRDS